MTGLLYSLNLQWSKEGGTSCRRAGWLYGCQAGSSNKPWGVSSLPGSVWEMMWLLLMIWGNGCVYSFQSASSLSYFSACSGGSHFVNTSRKLDCETWRLAPSVWLNGTPTMLWVCVCVCVCFIMRASFADPRQPFGISATAILCLIINNLSEVTLYSYSKQACRLYTTDDRLANSLVVCKCTVFKWMRRCNSLKQHWGNDLCLATLRLQISTAHFSPFLNITYYGSFLHDAPLYVWYNG